MIDIAANIERFKREYERLSEQNWVVRNLRKNGVGYEQLEPHLKKDADKRMGITHWVTVPIFEGDDLEADDVIQQLREEIAALNDEVELKSIALKSQHDAYEAKIAELERSSSELQVTAEEACTVFDQAVRKEFQARYIDKCEIAAIKLRAVLDATPTHKFERVKPWGWTCEFAERTGISFWQECSEEDLERHKKRGAMTRVMYHYENEPTVYRLKL